MNYNIYRKSQAWARKRRQAKYWHGASCLICGAKKVDIHHKTYRRIFAEDAKKDLVPLCRRHHTAVHLEAQRSNEHVWHITERRVNRARKGKRTWKSMTPYEREKFLGPAL